MRKVDLAEVCCARFLDSREIAKITRARSWERSGGGKKKYASLSPAPARFSHLFPRLLFTSKLEPGAGYGERKTQSIVLANLKESQNDIRSYRKREFERMIVER